MISTELSRGKHERNSEYDNTDLRNLDVVKRGVSMKNGSVSERYDGNDRPEHCHKVVGNASSNESFNKQKSWSLLETRQ